MLEFALAALGALTVVAAAIWPGSRIARLFVGLAGVVMFVGAFVYSESKDQDWQMDVAQRKALGEIVQRAPERFQIPVFWFPSDQSKNYAEDIALTFAAHGWGVLVGRADGADITRAVPAGVHIVRSKLDSQPPANAIKLQGWLKDAGLSPNPNIGTQDGLPQGMVGIVVAKQPVWRVSNLWR